MEKIVKATSATFIFVAAVVLISPFSALVGGFAGWTVGMFFGDTILRFLAEIGIRGFSMWDIGVCLGFFSAFLRTRVSMEE